MQKLKSILAFNNYLVVYAVITIVINIFIYSLPLVGVLGYEFSVVNAFMFYFLSGIFTISFLKRKNLNVNGKKTLVELLYFVIVIISVPFIIINIKTVLGLGCSFFSGTMFYLVISLPSLVVGLVMGSVAYIMVNKFRYVLFFTISILILLLPVIEIYFYPQIYFYNPIIAFYPGTIFDEGMNVSSRLLIYRSLNLLYFGFIGWGVFNVITQNYKGGKASIIAVILFPALTFFFISPSLGFSTDLSRVKTILNKTLTTNHFVIHYTDNYDKKEIEILALYHEYYYQQLSIYLNTEPQQKINTFIFKDDQQKKELFGSANADVAKPWLYQSYLSYENYQRTLQHELAHCFSAEFGTGLFRLAGWFNPSLIEGIASASDPYYDNNFITYMAALAYNNGYRVKLNRLYDNLNFFGQTASLSYIYSGAFTHFLIGNYGIEKFKLVYADLNFEKVYQKNIIELEKDFIINLESIEAINSASANFYFGRKSIIYKICPRYIAVKLDEAWSLYNSKQFNEAEILFNEILNYGENYSAILGLSYVYLESKQINKAINVIESNLAKFEKTSYYYHLQFRLADLLALNFDNEKAQLNYEQIAQNNPNRTLKYLTGIRIKLLAEGKLDEYIAGSDYDKLSLLKKINSQKYFYPAWAVIIDLSEKLQENTNLFMEEFNKTILVTDYESSYAVLKLSQYLLSKGEYLKARKMAALSLRYTDDGNFTMVLEENFKMINWFVNNSKNYSGNFIFN